MKFKFFAHENCIALTRVLLSYRRFGNVTRGDKPTLREFRVSNMVTYESCRAYSFKAREETLPHVVETSTHVADNI